LYLFIYPQRTQINSSRHQREENEKMKNMNIKIKFSGNTEEKNDNNMEKNATKKKNEIQ